MVPGHGLLCSWGWIRVRMVDFRMVAMIKVVNWAIRMTWLIHEHVYSYQVYMYWFACECVLLPPLLWVHNWWQCCYGSLIVEDCYYSHFIYPLSFCLTPFIWQIDPFCESVRERLKTAKANCASSGANCFDVGLLRVIVKRYCRGYVVTETN